ncbi:hypothetical protein Pint_13710 [Pistacia integerrima]|uniref:Uncharacterized protein n=1 Tax=Pistacia integerrima TaxID=434235 RepID=A0ACC0YAG5_9ROSI|nr:hypothetical protein Pint_13710 [Pistacia integerrima]
MERIYEAAVEGSVISLLNVLNEQPLVLDRLLVGCYTETPLHVASMLGHEEFVHEILRRKPELARELDYRKASPLHLATAKGYLGIVQKLVRVHPEICFVCDEDGRNPLHIAAMKGHVSVLKELVKERADAARVLMERGETILHLCVQYNQLEAMKLLMETMNDHEFVNSKDDDGQTILHLAVAHKQVKVIKFFVTSGSIEVNALNANGLTALDILTRSKRNVKDWEIGELLRGVGAISTKNTQLNSKGKDTKKVIREKQKDRFEKVQGSLMVVASLIATITYQNAINPLGGRWQENSPSDKPLSEQHVAGDPIIDDEILFDFVVVNTIGFVASLSIILLLISGIPFIRSKFFMWILIVIMWVAVTTTAISYLLSISIFSKTTKMFDAARYVSVVWFILITILLIVHLIRLMVKLIKCIRNLIRRIWRSSRSNSQYGRV